MYYKNPYRLMSAVLGCVTTIGSYLEFYNLVLRFPQGDVRVDIPSRFVLNLWSLQLAP